MIFKKPQLVILDGNSFVHRFWHALPETLTTADGLMVNIVYGFSAVLVNCLQEFPNAKIVVVFDAKGPSWRKEKYKLYKAHRKPKPPELYQQIPLVKEVLAAFSVPYWEKSGYEGDDLIASLVKSAFNQEKVILSGDLDLLQLIDSKTQVFVPQSKAAGYKIYTEVEVEERYNLKVKQLPDLKSLQGDTSDNIPGVPGVGSITATKLLQQFIDLDGVYKNIEQVTGATLRMKLKKGWADALLSRELVSFSVDLKIPESILKPREITVRKGRAALMKFQFISLIPKVDRLLGQSGQALKVGSSACSFEFIKDNQTLKKLITTLTEADKVYLSPQLEGQNWQQKIIAFTLSVDGKNAYYLNLTQADLNFDPWWQWLSTSETPKIAWETKPLSHALIAENKSVMALVDLELVAYLLDPDQFTRSLMATVLRYLPQLDPEFVAQLQLEVAADDQPSQLEFLGQSLNLYHQLEPVLMAKLEQLELVSLWKDLEQPLVPVLAKMERQGISLDLVIWKETMAEVSAEIKKLEKRIHDLAGEEFNLNSPAKLQAILFEKLGLSSKGIKKLKRGFSTNQQQLLKLVGQSPIIELIIKYRELAKLDSTYLQVLPSLIDPNSQRLHTIFQQTMVATGRLSSKQPNLQNLPVKTSLGKKMRSAFVASPGKVFVAADYSQVELRVAAHLSKDAKLIEIFKDNQDIHTATALALFTTPGEEVSSQDRSRAKVVNFGVLYGQGKRALAQSLKITLPEAQQFIDQYFETYQGLATYLAELKLFLDQHGYVQTVLGRRRYFNLKGYPGFRLDMMRRAALNHPFQGTAADLIKMAMLAVDKLSTDCGQKLLLQIHDELIWEVPQEKGDQFTQIIKPLMEEIFPLEVPLVVNVYQGSNWSLLK